MDGSLINDLHAALDEFYRALMHFLPRLMAATIILLAGWILTLVLRAIVRRALEAARFDRFSDNIGMTQVFRKADLKGSPSETIAGFIYWVVLTMALMAAINTLEIGILTSLVASFFNYLPRVFSAVLILVVGFLIGGFLSRAVVLAIVNAGLSSAALAGGGVRLLISNLAFAMALEQLQLASGIVRSAFTIAFGALMLSASLAFGLGGRDVAKRVLEEKLLPRKEKREDEITHI